MPDGDRDPFDLGTLVGYQANENERSKIGIIQECVKYKSCRIEYNPRADFPYTTFYHVSNVTLKIWLIHDVIIATMNIKSAWELPQTNMFSNPIFIGDKTYLLDSLHNDYDDEGSYQIEVTLTECELSIDEQNVAISNGKTSRAIE